MRGIGFRWGKNKTLPRRPSKGPVAQDTKQSQKDLQWTSGLGKPHAWSRDFENFRVQEF